MHLFLGKMAMAYANHFTLYVQLLILFVNTTGITMTSNYLFE